MPYRFMREETIEDGIRRIVLEQIHKAERELKGDDRLVTIHQMRKRCKKIRGALRLVRAGLGTDGATVAAGRGDARYRAP